jgi:ectoine hydroxylase-related dioxygenase (phytanoyl-CoA dioxygenase family)
MATATRRFLSAEQLEQWSRDGYLVVTGLLTAGELAELAGVFQRMHEHARRNGGEIPGCFTIGTAEEIAADPLKLYPRMLWPHRHDEVVRRHMLAPKLGAILWDLLGEEPLAAQSMFYWKPPGARGQALHQDNYYLRVKPGTCVAAWMPLDRSEEENGGLVVVPGTQDMEIVCPEEADPAVSFTRDLVRPPEGHAEVPVTLEPGDALFFNGSLIHGSYPNRSKDRFRRSFICHYFPASAEELAQHDRPALRFDGQAVEEIAYVTGGGPCGEATAVH